MNQMVVASTSSPLLPLGPLGTPALSPHLGAAMRDADRTAQDDQGRRRAAPVALNVVAEARVVLEGYLRRSDPASPDQVEAWMMPVAGSVGGTPNEGDFRVRCGLVRDACRHLPGWAFNQVSLRRALGLFKFLPSAAEVLELLAGHVSEHTAREALLRRIASQVQGKRPLNPEDQSWLRFYRVREADQFAGGSRGVVLSLVKQQSLAAYAEITGDEGETHDSVQRMDEGERAEVFASVRSKIETIKPNTAARADALGRPARECKPIDPAIIAQMRDADPKVRGARAMRGAGR